MDAAFSNVAVCGAHVYGCEMAPDSEEALRVGFADMERALCADREVPRCDPDSCAFCGSHDMLYCSSTSGHPGSRSCVQCGAVEAGNVYYERMYGKAPPRKHSNYKRVHHWAERLSQFRLLESEIPPQDMLQIGRVLLSGAYTSLTKDNIRHALRSLNADEPKKYTKYIEKWLQICYRLTGVKPPIPGPAVIDKLSTMFLDLQRPFEASKMDGRKNMLNYNYIFNRLFQRMGCEEFSMFFPLIKSKGKMRALDETWERMSDSMGWEFKPLQQVAPFAVKLESRAALLHRLETQCAIAALADSELERARKVSRMLDHRLRGTVPPTPKRRRSDPPALQFRRVSSLRRRSG